MQALHVSAEQTCLYHPTFLTFSLSAKYVAPWKIAVSAGRESGRSF